MTRLAFTLAAVPALVLAAAPACAGAQQPSLRDFFDVASPLELVTARSADRIAWTVYEAGQRNVYTAAAPGFVPVRLTSFVEDDGQEVSGVQLSEDGDVAIFIRGHAPNRAGWVANPAHDPGGSERAIWAVRTDGGPAWRVAAGSAPVLAPDGSSVLFVRDGMIFRAATRAAAAAGTRAAAVAARDSIARGDAPLIRSHGALSAPTWSPDGAHIAFVSHRGDHSFIGLYDVARRTVRYVSPSVDCDSNPMWSPDGRTLAFLRRPGTPFGLQDSGATCGASSTRALADSSLNQRYVPGLYASAFEDGAVLRIMIADIADVADIDSPPARVVWHNDPDSQLFSSLSRVRRAGDHIVFQHDLPDDEWERWWSIRIPADGRAAERQPVLLTTTDGLIEDATSVAFSADGSTMFYTTNASDIERRHIWSVPVAGGSPRQLTTGDDVETWPQPLPSGDVAVLHFGARTPASVAIVPAEGGAARRIYPDLETFPVAAHVVPEIVWLTAEDSVRFSNQLFLPADLRAGEQRAAIVFVHGGPRRQMMPAYHYMQFYHWSYAINQWLASQGYIVLSVNYRRGVGYGRSFTNADSAQGRGNAEYRDVIAAGRWLQARPDVDPARVGIWGLSYGGLLVAQALARDSDLFAAGVDMAGVHLYGTTIDSTALSYRSSAISEIGGWTSPVLLVHGDDDRNVSFSQTVGLVQLLRAHGIEHELIVIPDDVHESMLHSRWVYTWERMSAFLRRHLGP